MLSIEQKQYFLNAIVKWRQSLNKLQAENTLESFDHFENELTLNELEDCLKKTTPENINAQLSEILKVRWERIRGSGMCYTQAPNNMVNQFCLKLATAISPPITTKAEIEALAPNTGPYCLLMPSLVNMEDVYSENIHSLKLHEFVLSDDQRVFIPLAPCLHQASISDEGKLRHVVIKDGQCPDLTATEIERVSKHSKQANEFYQSVVALNKQRVFGENIGAKLSQLAVALRQGGVNRGRGDEYNAGEAANLGIATFYAYWESMPEQLRNAIFVETPELQEILGRLFRPKDTSYQAVRYCVESLAGALDSIIRTYNNHPTIQIFQRQVEAQENLFNTALQQPQQLERIKNTTPPKHILHRIYKLNDIDQKQFFRHSEYENALMYALAFLPEELFEFELDAKAKQQAITARIKADNDSALIAAIKSGKTNVVKLLLNWGR